MLRSLSVVLLGVALTTAINSAAWAEDTRPTEYQFTKPPLAIYDSLAELNAGDVPVMPDAERELLARVWQWRTDNNSALESRPDEATLIEAMLWASGIEDAKARARYRKQFDEVVAAAMKATKAAMNDRERGERLMQSLHAGVMKGGYDLDQTSFAAVFDGGKYNCVSSTAMYLLAGQRLELKLVPISIPGQPFVPGHAAIDMVDGSTRIEVEPTNPDGFDWGTKSKEPGVIIIGFVPDRTKGHATDELGIAASIYTNRGVALAKGDEPQRPAAIRANISALALDPLDETATNNLTSDFVNWGPALAKASKFEDAVRVLEFGRQIAPQSREVKGNLVAVYSQHIGATLASEKDQEAMALIAQAAQSLPDERDFQSPAEWFKRASSQRQEDAGYEAGLAVVERALACLPPDEHPKLREWRSSLFRQWSQDLLEKPDVDGSVNVLARAYALDEDDESIHEGLGHHTMKALEILDTVENSKLVEHFTDLARQFPRVEDVAEAGFGFAFNRVLELADAEKFEEAISAATRFRALVSEPEKQAELGSLPLDRWGRNLAEKKEWQKACDKYAEALKEFPEQPTLVQNLAATITEWADPEIEAMNWDEAIRIYDVGLAILPEHGLLVQNRRICEERKQGE